MAGSDFETVMYIIEISGVAAFAIYGATLAYKSRLDAFGAVVLGLISALGGGVIRDVILDINPPIAFSRLDYSAVAIVCSILTYLYGNRRTQFQKSQKVRDSILNVVDAFGLGVFTVSGVNSAVAVMGTGNMYLAIFMGVISGIGGGMMRDVLVGQIPFVLYKHIYALASLAGSIVYFLMIKFGIGGELIPVVVCVAFVVVIRIVATVAEIDLPRSRMPEEEK